MIVPSSRSLQFGTLILVPFTVLAATAPELRVVSLSVLALFIGALTLDAALSVGLGRSASVQLPPTVQLNRRCPGQIPFTLHAPGLERVPIRFGLPLPETYELPDESLVLADAPPSEDRLGIFPCTPRDRGITTLEYACLGFASPLRLWEKHLQVPITTSLHVYPNLELERRKIAARFLRHRRQGQQAIRAVGKGREFEKLRDYQPGDSYEDIHWKATARRHQPVTKLYQIEQTQRILVCIDHGRLSGRQQNLPDGDRDPLLETMLQAGLLLGAAARQQGDHFGLLAFADRITRYIPPGSSAAHYQACREAVCTLETQSRATDFIELSRYLHTRLRKRSLVVLVTSLDDPVGAEQCAESLALLSRRHLVLTVNIRPESARPVFSGPRPSTLIEAYRECSGHQQWMTLHHAAKSLQQQGILVQHTVRAELTPTLVQAYMDVRRRQLV